MVSTRFLELPGFLLLITAVTGVIGQWWCLNRLMLFGLAFSWMLDPLHIVLCQSWPVVHFVGGVWLPTALCDLAVTEGFCPVLDMGNILLSCQGGLSTFGQCSGLQKAVQVWEYVNSSCCHPDLWWCKFRCVAGRIGTSAV